MIINYTIQQTKKLLHKLFIKKSALVNDECRLDIVLFVIRFMQLQGMTLDRFLEVCGIFFRKIHKKENYNETIKVQTI